MRYVIIGSGVAGIAAVEAIRSVDKEGDIFLIGDDPHGYYSRPGLAYYLTGELHDKALYPLTSNDFRGMKIRYAKEHVSSINREEHCLKFDIRTSLSYDRLLIAVGAQAVPLKVDGANLNGVLKLDHMEDANHILKFARRGKSAIVIGGGITALELVEGLVSQGMKVHYLLRGDRYWSNVLDEHESVIVETRLESEGVKLHFRSEVKEIVGKKGNVSGVLLNDGSILKTDLVAYAIGIRPRVDLAKQAGLKIDRGIVLDEHLRTNDPDIFAAGDVAQVYDPVTKRFMLDSLWSPARQQGHAAGLNMAGVKTPYLKSIPFNVTRLAGLTTTIIGTVGSGNDEDLIGIARGDSETWRQLPKAVVAQSGFEVNRLRLLIGEKTILGAIVMGDQTLSLPLERIISDRMDISSIRDALFSSNGKIGDLIADFWSQQRAAQLTKKSADVKR